MTTTDAETIVQRIRDCVAEYSVGGWFEIQESEINAMLDGREDPDKEVS